MKHPNKKQQENQNKFLSELPEGTTRGTRSSISFW